MNVEYDYKRYSIYEKSESETKSFFEAVGFASNKIKELCFAKNLHL